MKNYLKILSIVRSKFHILEHWPLSFRLNLTISHLSTKIAASIFVLFLIVFSSFSSDERSVTNYFTIPNNISNDTEISENIDIFFEYTDAFYTLPDRDQPTDIFHDPDVWDPLECYNRVVFSFNLYSARWVIQPLAMVYSFIVPEYVRKGIRRIDSNIQMPGRVINSLLQAKFSRTGVELARFGINTTVGIAGFYDPAYDWFDMEPRIMSFGQTFAYWGIGKGFYLILPIFGSTCLRDGIGVVGDYFANPITWIPPYIFWNWISWGIKFGLGFNNMTLDLESYLRICHSSVDPYETVKNVWMILEKIKNTRDAESREQRAESREQRAESRE